MNNTKKLNLYGLEKHNEAYAAFQRLQQMGFEVPSNFDITIFRAGFMAAIEADKINKARAADRKAKKFVITDFIDIRLDYNRNFLKGIYYDKENKTMVTTNGCFMVYAVCDNIPAQYENQIVDKNGVIIEARFPKWQNVVPDNKDVVNTNINFNMTMAAANKDRRAYKIGEFVFGAKMIKYMDLFLKTQKNVVVKGYKEDRTRYDGSVQPRIERAVVLTGDTATMVVMPYIASNFNAEDIIYIGEAAA